MSVCVCVISHTLKRIIKGSQELDRLSHTENAFKIKGFLFINTVLLILFLLSRPGLANREHREDSRWAGLFFLGREGRCCHATGVEI